MPATYGAANEVPSSGVGTVPDPITDTFTPGAETVTSRPVSAKIAYCFALSFAPTTMTAFGNVSARAGKPDQNAFS